MTTSRDPDSFAEAMEELGDVEASAGPAARVSRGPAGQQRQTLGDSGERESAPEAPDFHFPTSDEPLLAHRSGLRRRELRQLRAGRVLAERRIDLHGCDRRAARLRLVEELSAARAAEERCALVIHGRGHRSGEGEAVLRRELPEWLTSPPLGAIVQAFAPAQPRDGGAGACYVLLG